MAFNNKTSPSGNMDAMTNLAKLLNKGHQDILSQAGRTLPNLQVLHDIIKTVLTGGIIDDRSYLIENLIQVVTSLPNGSGLRDNLSSAFISRLWNTLQHPPISYLGAEFKYRTADGHNNNIMYPQLGAAGSHYARTVTPLHPRPSVLPDPSLIFDTLLARNGPMKEHPSQISSNLFYLATIIIHDLFYTDYPDRTKLKNSSYLDLGPLYGHNQEQQNGVRTFEDGLLKNDTFAESRLLGQPPGVSALLIAFNRFHNYVVREIALINESGRFSMPDTENNEKREEALKERDNDLFQTGRLITCGLYVNMILNDYLRTILNLNRNPENSDWKLDPRENLKVFDSHGIPQGVGNQVSAEFNMVYRWHATISKNDEAWGNKFLAEIFGDDVDPNNLTVEDFRAAMAKMFKGLSERKPETYTLGDLQRQEDGTFPDAELVRLLQEGTENIAGAFGARNTPRFMKVIEKLGIQEGRDWGLATLNEFRLFFNLKPYTTFAQVNSDPAVAEALEALYGHPDNIELYPGIQAEEAKVPYLPGSGLCPGFTISVAILSDAVALVRGDRFYTTDYSPATLTNFGYKAASSDFDIAEGGVMYKLLMRAFPGWFQPNSVYALYPFTTPKGNREIYEKLGTAKDLDFSKPSFSKPPIPITKWQGVVDILKDQKRFRVPWGKHTFQLTSHDYMLSGDLPANTQQRYFVNNCLYRPENGLAEVRKYYESVTSSLLRRHSNKLRGSYQVDIVRDIGNLANANFVSHFFNIPMRDNGTNCDAYTDAELYDVLARLFGYVFLDLDPVQSLKHRVVATREARRLGEVVQKSTGHSKLHGFQHLLMMCSNNSLLVDYGAHLVERLFGGRKRIDEVVWTVIPTAAAACATQAQGWAQMIDLYLSDAYYCHWPDIQNLARSEDPAAFEKLKKYALEGFRLSTPAFGVLRIAAEDTRIENDEGPPTVVERGDVIFTDFITAGRDPSKFPQPTKIKLDRPDEYYIHHGWGPHSCLGREIVTVAGASMLRVLGRLGNLRRAPGPAGEMKYKLVNDAFKMYLPEDGSEWTPFPCNKKVIFDGFGWGV